VQIIGAYDKADLADQQLLTRPLGSTAPLSNHLKEA
jgi:hypothetical protein